MENKRYLVVTHGVDIDGMGPIVLARAAFGAGNVDAYFVNNVAETSNAVKKALSKIDEYERVFVTDVCPSFETLCTINGNEEYKAKVAEAEKSLATYEKEASDKLNEFLKEHPEGFHYTYKSEDGKVTRQYSYYHNRYDVFDSFDEFTKLINNLWFKF